MSLARLCLTALVGGCLLAGSGRAQLAPVTSTRTWARTYGGPVAQQGLYDLRQLPGGTLAVAGFTGSFGTSSPSGWLMHVEQPTGDVLLERAIGVGASGVTDGAAVAADGGALFLGRIIVDLFVKHDGWLVRTDPEGAVVWVRRFTQPGTGRHFLFDAVELADGSWVAAGATGLLDHPPQAAWVVRLTAAGDLLWQYEYGGGLSDTARAITPTSDGGFAVAGWTNSAGAGLDDAWVMKIDAGGGVVWQRTFGGLDSDQAEHIVELPDGGFAVAGSSNSLTSTGHAPWVLRLDAGGGLLWHRVVGSDVWGDLGAVELTADGQLVVVGRVGEPGFPTNDLWCAQLEADTGATRWQRAYEGDSGDFGSAVLPLSGDSVVLGGTWGWGFEDESVWLLRTGRKGGFSDCDIVRPTSFELSSPPVTVGHGPLVRSPGTTPLLPFAATSEPSHATVTAICR